MRAVVPVVVLACMPTLFFDTGMVHALVVSGAVGMMLYGLHVMRRTVMNVITPDVGLVVHSGAFYLMTAIVIMTSSHYYFYLKRHMAPTAPVADYATGVDATTAVDDYVRHIVTQDTRTVPVAPSSDESSQPRDPSASYGTDRVAGFLREVLSPAVSRDVHGTDLARDVFVDMIDMQLSALINRNQTLHRYRVEIFGTTFFIVVTALSPLVRFVVMWAVRGSVYVLRRYAVIRTTDRTVRVTRVVL